MKKQISFLPGIPAENNLAASKETVIQEIHDRLRDVNVVSFSGGKDSSTVLSLVLAAMQGEHQTKKLYIVTADTGMEIPYFQQYVEDTQRKIKDYIERSGINAEVVTVRPQAKYGFWASVLGKGYPAAHMGFRWCTGKLKIDPITKFLHRTVGKDGMTFVGVRAAESELRARIYTKKDYKAGHFLPILDWSAGDVWEYLMTEPCPWGDHSKLIEVYKYSSDECVYGEKGGVCVGNARYGCWACPLQKAAQLDMLAFHTGDDRYGLLKGFKQKLTALANNQARRSRVKRNGTIGTGPFLMPIREQLFSDLKTLERKTGWQFLSAEEEQYIREDWEKDRLVHTVSDCKQMMMFG